MNTRNRWYIGQYGYFWSFSYNEMIKFLEQAITDDGFYELPSHKEVGRPHGIFVADNGGYYSTLAGPHGRYFEPLDWDKDDFEDVLSDLKRYSKDTLS